jgi:5-methylcytosine-specific restriction endonuclease McrA
MHIVILHVQEVSRRKLYLARGYGSLKNYLIEVLKYSGPSAQRRIEAAKLVTAVPSLSEKLEAGQINLSQIGEMHRAIGLAEKTHHEKITESAKADIIEKVAGQNVIATQQICAEFFDVPVVESQRVKTQKDFSKRLELTLSKEQFAKFEQVRDLLAHKNFQKKRSQSIADVLETMFDEFLEKRSAGAKHAPADSTSCETDTDFSNQGRPKQRSTSAEVSLGDLAKRSPKEESETAKWTSLTPKRRKLILQKSNGCEFQDAKSGRVCSSTFNLQVDHIRPKWDGGSNDPSNLRVLCREHNIFRYRHD